MTEELQIELGRRYHFAASHRLHTPLLNEEENCRIFGKCNNPHGHGHNYALEVTVSGPVDDQTGMVCNLVDLDECVDREVLSCYHLENLNTRKEFAVTVPTTENLCIEIFEILQRAFAQAHLERVRLEETMMNSFEYAGSNIARR